MTTATDYRVPAAIVQALTDNEYVRVVGPTGVTWTGTIIGASAEPCMLLKTSDGVQMLPQSFRVERLTKRRVHIWYWNDRDGFPAWTWCREVKGNIYDDASRLIPFPNWDAASRAAFAWLAGKPLTWHHDGHRLICDACGSTVFTGNGGASCVGCLRTTTTPQHTDQEPPATDKPRPICSGDCITGAEVGVYAPGNPIGIARPDCERHN